MSELTHPSPNFTKRTEPPKYLILHGTTGTDKGDLQWCGMDKAAMQELWDKTPKEKRPAKPWSPVSYDEIVGRNGTRYTLVDSTKHYAHHAGESEWNGRKWLNSISIGLAFSNKCDGKEALTPQQMAVMQGIVEGLARTVPSLEAVLTHTMVSPTRKFDPENCLGFVFSEYEEAFKRGVATR